MLKLIFKISALATLAIFCMAPGGGGGGTPRADPPSGNSTGGSGIGSRTFHYVTGDVSIVPTSKKNRVRILTIADGSALTYFHFYGNDVGNGHDSLAIDNNRDYYGEYSAGIDSIVVDVGTSATFTVELWAAEVP